MKPKSRTLRPLLPVATLGILSVSAAPFTPTRVVPMPSDSPNQFTGSFRMGFNVKTSFENVGAFTSAPSQTTPAGDAFNYDDGYVLTDSSGNQMGYTRYWGYTSPGQLPGNGTLLMHRSTSAGSTVGGEVEEPLPGFELTFRRELWRGETLRWGVEVAGNYMPLRVHSSGAATSLATRQTDAYALPTLEGGGYVTPPQAPYFQGPDLPPGGSIVIGANPVSSITDAMLASASGARDFDANILGLRLGPYVEMPVGAKGRLSLSGGLSFAYVLSDFDFQDDLTTPIARSFSGGGSDSGGIVGAYLAGEASYQFSPAWEVYGAAEFQYLDKYSHSESGRTAVLDMTKSVFVSFGVKYTF